MVEVKEVSADAEERVGRLLKDKWALVRLIGVGGTGAVYEAVHRNQKRVAVKIMHRHLGALRVQRARFLKEGYAANRVGHPGVASIFDEDIDEDGSPFLVSELLEGMTVAQRAEALGGRLPPLEALDIADQLLDVLVAAHARGILHRDIKPENLFLTASGELKVLDFGIARFTEHDPSVVSTVAGTLLGTPAFVSPEQAAGNLDEVDERTDIWSVGATLFTLLSSEFVHPAPTANAQIALSMTRPARSLATAAPTLPRAVVAVVDRALCFSPGDRWPDAKSMQQAVRLLGENWSSISAAPDEIPEGLGVALDPIPASRTTVPDPTAVADESGARPPTRKLWFLGAAAVCFAALAPAFTSSRASASHEVVAASAPSPPPANAFASMKSEPIGLATRVPEPASPTIGAIEASPSVEPSGRVAGTKTRAEPAVWITHHAPSNAAATPAAPSPAALQESEPAPAESDIELLNRRH